jgi:hypothetical protein
MTEKTEKSLRLKNAIRNVLALTGVFALGWALHGRTVHAADDSIQFQWQEVRPGSSLLVYHPSEKTIYVYQGATTGNSALQCSFRYHLTDAGGVIRRENCPMPSLLR